MSASNRSFVDLGLRQHFARQGDNESGQTVRFSNNQYFDITGNRYVQNISQSTTLTSYTTTSQKGMQPIVDIPDLQLSADR